ncbi:thioredoxin-like fold domain-containing MRL7L, chloroplastic [Olea europaea subsp. europaea]|uniref:Thioredoxin-like fold domain-containing MRL7L, chloroplastic n=1 Tax=Olea europaea subsp. europaea TaxID=158383 RepID=A0A8S0P8D5_OLEEU|nr:thioredoxin-like fold domain-containing MRL7L, chloroplastic [Olea europaea subsp. europaea]
MELFQLNLRPQFQFTYVKEKCLIDFSSSYGASCTWRKKQGSTSCLSSRMVSLDLSARQLLRSPLRGDGIRRSSIRVSKIEELLRLRGGKEEEEDESSESEAEEENDDNRLMDEKERKEWRQKIREVIDKIPGADEEIDLVERRKKMQKLLAEYPLVVEEDDPDWPENADGWGFNLDQFFNKITVKNVKKDDDEDYDSENELVWQDDDYIRPIKDITSAEWEEAVFKDISPLIVLVHNRYKRPKENGRIRDELEKAIHIIWNCRLPSPRCVAIDAVLELDLVSALQVSGFPEVIFTKAGKILYRENGARTADELSKIMAFFYYGAAKPPCLSNIGNTEEPIPAVQTSSKSNSKV